MVKADALRARPRARAPGRRAPAAPPGSASPSSPRRWRCGRPAITGPDAVLAARARRRLRRGVARRHRPVGVSALWALRGDRGRRRGRPGAPPGCTSRSTPACPAAAASRPTGRTWSTPRRAAEAEGAVEVVGRLVALRLGRRARPPDRPRQRERFAEAVAPRPSGRAAGPRCGTWRTRPPTLTDPTPHFDLVRPGHRGLRPLAGARPGRARDFGLRPAMTLRGAAGAGQAGPGRAGVSLRARRYTTAARHDPRRWCRSGTPTASRGTPATPGRCWSPGGAARIAGRVCMDQFVVDLGATTPRARGRRGRAVRGRRRRRADRRRTGPRPPAPSRYEIVTRIGAAGAAPLRRRAAS